MRPERPPFNEVSGGVARGVCQADPEPDTGAPEWEIDHLMCELCDLTPEEIKIVDTAFHEATQGKGDRA